MLKNLKINNVYISNNDKKKEVDINNIKSNYTVIGLFYYCKDVKSYIYNQTIKKYLDAIIQHLNI